MCGGAVSFTTSVHSICMSVASSAFSPPFTTAHLRQYTHTQTPTPTPTHTPSHAHTRSHTTCVFHIFKLWPHLCDSAVRESRSPSCREGDFIEQHLPHDRWFGDVYVQARPALSAPSQGNGWDDTQDAAMRGCQIPVHLKCGGVREVYVGARAAGEREKAS